MSLACGGTHRGSPLGLCSGCASHTHLDRSHHHCHTPVMECESLRVAIHVILQSKSHSTDEPVLLDYFRTEPVAPPSSPVQCCILEHRIFPGVSLSPQWSSGAGHTGWGMFVHQSHTLLFLLPLLCWCLRGTAAFLFQLKKQKCCLYIIHGMKVSCDLQHILRWSGLHLLRPTHATPPLLMHTSLFLHGCSTQGSWKAHYHTHMYEHMDIHTHSLEEFT